MLKIARLPSVLLVLPPASNRAQKITSMIDPKSTPAIEMKNDLRRPSLSNNDAPHIEMTVPTVPLETARRLAVP